MFFISGFYTFLVSISVTARPNSKKSILVYAAVTPELAQH